MKWNIGSKIGFGFAVALLILIAVSIITYTSISDMQISEQNVRDTETLLHDLDNLISYVKDAETGQRGFILTGEDEYLEPYKKAIQTVDSMLTQIETLAQEKLQQGIKVRELRSLIKEKFEDMEETIIIRRAGKFLESVDHIKTQRGKEMMDNVREITNEIITEEQTKLAQLREVEASSTERTFYFIIISTISACLIFLLLGYFITLNIAKPLKEFSLLADKIASGDFSTIVPVDKKRNDEIGTLRINLSKMNSSLKKITDENNKKNWVKTGQNELNEQIQGNIDINIVAKNAINYLCKYLNAKIGTVYITDDEGKYLKLFGSYAFNKRKGLKNVFEIGEGIIGQAALEKEIISITDIPEDYIRINSSFGDSLPKNIVAIPLLYDNKTQGVIELGSFNEFSDLEMDFLNSVSESVAIAINSAKSNQKQAMLLKEIKVKEAELSGQINAINKSNAAVEFTMDGIILRTNDIFLKMMGYSSAELIGGHHSIFVEEKYKNSPEYQNFWETLRAGEFQSGEFKRIAKNGNPVWIRGSYNPVFDEEGHPYKVIKITQDITDEKKQQELLKQQKEELEVQQIKLEETNAELEAQTEKLRSSEEELKVQHEEIKQANQELEDKAQMLEEKNDAIHKSNVELERARKELEIKAEELAITSKYKSEFLANMSHELRTPLNSILLLSKLLTENKKKNLSKEQMEYAGVIHNSGNSLLELINEVLDLSKIEAGKMDIELTEVEFKNIIHTINSVFQPIAEGKNIEFLINIDDRLPEKIITDKMRLEQVLKNLLSNALKFTEVGEVSLQIYPVIDKTDYRNKELMGRNMIAFSVIDTGIGIPSDKQKLIFEAFQQVDGSTKRKYGGTGLGLSISREIAILLGGEIHIESKIGKGSKFTLYLPGNGKLTDKQVSDVMHENSSIGPLLIEKRNGKTVNLILDDIPDEIPDDRNNIGNDDKTILVVEDDTRFAGVLLNFLHEKGYKGVVTVRGDYAVKFAEKYKPVGILLDLQLPVMDGWAVMDLLKKNDKTRQIPVHIMSAFEAKKESLEKGAVDFIEKPFAIEKITESIKRLEYIVNKEKKKILIVEDSHSHAKAISDFLSNSVKECIIANTAKEGMEILERDEIDCIILDMGLPDATGYSVLENIRSDSKYELLPIIVYTGKSLSREEENKIKKYASTIIIKTADSYERLLDETTLFLHLVKKHNGEEKRKAAKPYIADKSLENKTILIADDDMRNVFSLTKVLETHRMKVVSANTGREALDIVLKGSSIDIILMDIMMPEMDGYETMKRLRMDNRFAKLPIIALTAKAMLGDRAKCINAGASDYISKPVDIDQLISLIRVWLYS